MQHRHLSTNIPTELVRTFAVVAETGSYTKAGQRLKLSQPAISAHVKRLQKILGGEVFKKAAGGVSLTARGNLVLNYARRFLDANDRMLSLGGETGENPIIRLGLSTIYVREFLSVWDRKAVDFRVVFQCDSSSAVTKSLRDGYIDIACLLYAKAEVGAPLFSWSEEMVWVRSSGFVISPGQAIPLVTSLGNVEDFPSVRALEAAGLNYQVVFASSDHAARVSAVEAGLGLMVLPLRYVPKATVVASEYYLPPLEKLKAGIYFRSGADLSYLTPMVSALRALKPARTQSP